ncbi:aminopeptidase N-like [Planococcus citri]|uniref:aminopeptidase N-like n=1 Tax=Planococcus citri TaxID=170843 RepID=UPI0031F9DA74
MAYLKYLLLFLNVALLHASPLHLNEDDLLQFDQKENEVSEVQDIYRLSDEVIPKSYQLNMEPDLEKFTFSGKVEIEISVRFSTGKVILHSKNLKINSCKLLSTRKSLPNKFKLDEANEILIIETEETLLYGTGYTLIIEFEGVLNDDMKGFYRSSYTMDNKKYWLAVTQFETSSAREAFPCFDEPRFRTPFQISVSHFSNQNAISNMPQESRSYTRDPSGRYRIWTGFKRTPPMATYLVAFMVSEFTYVTDDDDKIKVYVRPNAKKQASYALQQSTKSLKQMEGYIGIPHKLPKLDVVGVPDFEAGAMENWGMTTYRERFVIMDEQLPSSAIQKSAATQVISHEFAHQWFGDLVTPAWWDYLWLNEGFARYFEYFTTARIEPTWDMDKFFVIGQVQPTLWNEIGTQRAMTTSVSKKNQLDDIFDVISYSKAASIIRMFEHMVSPSVFKSALQKYLKNGAEKYDGTVVPAHLFEAFDEQTSYTTVALPEHTSISDIMKPWTENIGYPLVTVSRCYHHGKVSITQTTYKSPRAPKTLPDQKWIIPLTYTTKSELKFSNTKPNQWSFAEKPTRLPETFPNSDWVLFNLQHTGYYRVNYDLKNWQLLTDQLLQQPGKIVSLNRAQLIDDSFALAYEDKLDYKVPLNLIQYLPKEKDIFPWITAATSLNMLLTKYEPTLLNSQLKSYIRGILEKSFDNVGFEVFESDSHANKVGKPIFLELACRLGVKSCVDKAAEAYTKNKNDLNGVKPDLKKVVFCSALRDSEDKQNAFDSLWKLYLKPDIVNDKMAIIESLSCVKDEDIVKKVLSKLIDSKNEEIRKQDTFYFYRALLSNSETSRTTAGIKFLQDKISAIPEMDKHGISAFENILKKIKNNVKTNEQLQLLKDLEQKSKTLDQTKFGYLTTIIQGAQTKGSNSMQENIKKAEILIPIITQILSPGTNDDKTSPASPTSPSPTSGAATLVSSMWTHVIIVGIFLRYGIPAFNFDLM